MNSQDAYKIGFLLRCAEEGLTPEQTEQRIKTASMAKTAVLGLEAAGNMVGKTVSAAGKGLLSALRTAGWLTVVAPPVAGMAGGYMLAKSKNDTFDIEEAKKDEELAEYYRAMDMLGRSQRNRAAA